jgi:hypothetical protein
VTGDTERTPPSRQVTTAVIPVLEDSVTEQSGPQDAVIVEDVVVGSPIRSRSTASP